MENQRVEYIRKSGKRTGHKKGVLFCGIDPVNDKKVIMGFSLCHSIDRFDYINGKRDEGFGLDTAKLRANKWKNHADFFVQNTHNTKDLNDYTEKDIDLVYIINPEPKSILEIPPSVMVRLKTFIERCGKYYKDKEFPVWVHKVEQGEEYPSNLLEKQSIFNELEPI